MSEYRSRVLASGQWVLSLHDKHHFVALAQPPREAAEHIGQLLRDIRHVWWRAECRYCGRRCSKKGPLQRTKQHMLPRSRGGPSTPENYGLCCLECQRVMNGLDDCPATVACLQAVGEGETLLRGPRAAESAARRRGLWHLERAGRPLDRASRAAGT